MQRRGRCSASRGNFAALRGVVGSVDVVDSKVAAMEDHVLWRVKANAQIDARYAFRWRLAWFLCVSVCVTVCVLWRVKANALIDARYTFRWRLARGADFV